MMKRTEFGYPSYHSSPQLEGQGIAQALTEAAVRYASVVGLKIRPTCSFAKCFYRHTQYKDIVRWS